ncbi:MAG: phage holin family protein [Patescibacteria group bacterium]|jgi:putative membrane protein
MKMLIKWLLATVAIMIAAYLLPGVEVDGFFAALIGALVMGLINTFIRPVLVIFTLPINILTLGLFTLVINALLIILMTTIVPGFFVASFWWAMLFGVVLTIVNWFLSKMFR